MRAVRRRKKNRRDDGPGGAFWRAASPISVNFYPLKLRLGHELVRHVFRAGVWPHSAHGTRISIVLGLRVVYLYIVRGSWKLDRCPPPAHVLPRFSVKNDRQRMKVAVLILLLASAATAYHIPHPSTTKKGGRRRLATKGKLAVDAMAACYKTAKADMRDHKSAEANADTLPCRLRHFAHERI